MDQVERKLTFDQSSNGKTKNFRNEFDQTITRIENLSNEYFHQIFDYSKHDESYTNNYKQFLLLNKQCFQSKYGWEFQRMSFFRGYYISQCINDVYRLVFALPTLKYFMFLFDCYAKVTLPMATSQQLSTIEYLATYQYCAFNELLTILSYTPQICHLKLGNSVGIHKDIQTLPITLLNLTDISIPVDHVICDEFEILIRKIDAKLKVLHITTQSNDLEFLNARQWKQLILKYFPQLDEFYLQYIDKFNIEYQYLGGCDQFLSSFWIERQWIFEVEIDHESITYFIRPYRKRWYEYIHDNIFNSAIEYSKSTRLTIEYINLHDIHETLTADTARVLAIAQIYHLDMTEENVYVGALIETVRLLPELTLLKIHSLSLHEPVWLYSEEQIIWHSMDYTNLKKIKHDCNEYLRLLYFRVPTADEEMIQKLTIMINLEKFPWNFKN
ncbi:unnamed protein product [Rotaria magnacalcarata]|nr:unnamed protein product [Rotaria magnacalcarata]